MTFNVGDRVARGPKWHYGYQDHLKGEPAYGTVVEGEYAGSAFRWVKVRWDNGRTDAYEIYDLTLDEPRLTVIQVQPTLNKFFDI